MTTVGLTGCATGDGALAPTAPPTPDPALAKECSVSGASHDLLLLPGDDGQAVGTEVTLEVSFADPGTADTHSALVEWGDGSRSPPSPVTAPFRPTHAYAAPLAGRPPPG